MGGKIQTPTTMSVRLLWPFARVSGDYVRELEIARDSDFDPRELTNPDGRIPTLLARRILSATIEKTGDRALGIHAGELIESGDFGVMGLAVRNCPDLRTGFRCIARYFRLLDDNIEGVLVEERDRCIWQVRNLIPRPLAAVNDFQITVAIKSIERMLRSNEPPIEIHVRHHEPTDAAEYARVWRAPVRYDSLHNAVVMPRAWLDARIPQANPSFFAAFDTQAQQGLTELAESDGIRMRVHRTLARRLGEGNAGIASIARELHMSVSTLRRRLAEEGTTYSKVQDEVRRELALHHVHERRLSLGEIAFLLGFASQSAFGRAFRRWAGNSPLAYRADLQNTDG